MQQVDGSMHPSISVNVNINETEQTGTMTLLQKFGARRHTDRHIHQYVHIRIGGGELAQLVRAWGI